MKSVDNSAKNVVPLPRRPYRRDKDELAFLPAALEVVEALSKMSVPEAALALARHAVFSESLDVQELATEKIKSFPEDNYVPAVLASLVTPTMVQTAVATGLDGRLTIRQMFQCERQDRKQLDVLDHSYQPIGIPMEAAVPVPGIFNPRELAAQGATVEAGLRELAVTVHNLRVEEFDQRICKLLRKTTGQEFPDRPELWWQWWNDHNEVFQSDGKPYSQSE